MRKNIIKAVITLLLAATLTACGHGENRNKTSVAAESAATNQTAKKAGDVSRKKVTDTETTATVSTEVAGTAKSKDGMSQLKARLTREVKHQTGDWSICVKRLDSGESFSINNRAMRSASLIKLYIAGAYYEAVQSGTVKDTYGDTVDIMLQQSDNAAANTLIDLLGYDAINSFIKTVGASDTTIERKMLEQTTRENYTSVEDCADILELVLDGKYVNKTSSARILEDLKKQQRTSKIPAGVPSGVQTANKTGELTSVENDAAIVWGSDCTYILVIMTDNLTDTPGARQEIVDISEIVYDALK